MNKIVSIILGLGILIGSGALFAILGKPPGWKDPALVPLCCGLIVGVGLAYTVMHNCEVPCKSSFDYIYRSTASFNNIWS